MYKISQSKMKTWRRCHKAYDYKYNQHLESRRKKRPLVFGSIGHEMIEANANGDDPKDIIKKYETQAKKLFSAERPEYLEVVSDAKTVMNHYFEYYKKDKMKFVAIGGKLAEHKFEVKFANGILLKGTIDAVMRDPENRIWLVEHKSHKVIPNDDQRFRDLQTIIYTSVLESLGIKKVDGVMWDYIRSKPPTVPELLKNGKLSVARIDTLQNVYLKAIVDNKLNPKDYKKKLKELEGNEVNFFKRVFMPINPTLYNTLIKETVETANEMSQNAATDKTRNITKDCSWCSFESLCRAELLGIDADLIRKKEFIEEEHDEDETTEED